LPFFDPMNERNSPANPPTAGDHVAQAAGGIVGAIAGAAIGSTAGGLGTLLGGLAGAVGGWWSGRAIAERKQRRRPAE
jgi:outer membrane lipoprotein SlyB